MAPTPRTPRPARPVRHEELLHELVELFLAEGFIELSLADLARRLRCSKTTLYAVAPSKEQIVVAVVRTFFRRSTERVEASLDAGGTPVERLEAYLLGISRELAPASPAFFADVDVFAPAREIYTRNTQIAAARVQQLVRDCGPSGGGVDPTFLGVVAGQVMESINRGRIEAETGLDDSAAYRALADLIVAGVSGRQRPTAPTKEHA
jgi:AcrR family transcriptional regulator